MRLDPCWRSQGDHAWPRPPPALPHSSGWSAYWITARLRLAVILDPKVYSFKRKGIVFGNYPFQDAKTITRPYGASSCSRLGMKNPFSNHSPNTRFIVFLLNVSNLRNITIQLGNWLSLSLFSQEAKPSRFLSENTVNFLIIPTLLPKRIQSIFSYKRFLGLIPLWIFIGWKHRVQTRWGKVHIFIAWISQGDSVRILGRGW